VTEYWEPAKKLLNNPNEFLESLLKYEKDNIPDGVIKRIEPYIAMEEFTPDAVSKVSKACTSICMWARCDITPSASGPGVTSLHALPAWNGSCDHSSQSSQQLC
jgi:Microtubule-binding stalk of dynein motor